jgi:CRP-like cAMP-binding protein
MEPHVNASVRGSLEDFLEPGDIALIRGVSDREWDALRRRAFIRLAWHFCTLRNLWTHRGRYLHDVIGFGWAGIFRSLRVGSIVTTSYRNEGHFRAGERIFGTEDFFGASFRLPRASSDVRELVRIVNLRHHVAGVVTPTANGDVEVLPGYEADYAYVATAFIESLRRGYATCGIPPESHHGRRVATELCTILYHIAGAVGLGRMPRDLAAHERFCAAYERRIENRPPSSRVRRMAQEIARRILPVTAAMTDATCADHVARHFDPATAAYLFPDATVFADLEPQRAEWKGRLRGVADGSGDRITAREAVWQRADVVVLWQAYERAGPRQNADRLIGAILLHALDEPGELPIGYARRAVTLAANEPLIIEGETVRDMYVVLAATAPLVVLKSVPGQAEPQQVAALECPTVLGEIGMWRGKPAVATVLCREPATLDMIVIDQQQFDALKEESGFRAATAAEVQRRLAINSSLLGTLLHDEAERTCDPRLRSVAQLVGFLSGRSHVPLDAVIDLPDDATPAECVEALRHQAESLVQGPALSPALKTFLEQVVATIG